MGLLHAPKNDLRKYPNAAQYWYPGSWILEIHSIVLMTSSDLYSIVLMVSCGIGQGTIKTMLWKSQEVIKTMLWIYSIQDPGYRYCAALGDFSEAF